MDYEMKHYEFFPGLFMVLFMKYILDEIYTKIILKRDLSK